MPDRDLASVSVLVVSYNTCEHLQRCLASLRACRDASLREVLVADNASQDGSAEMVRREFPNVAVVETGANLGFAAAVNRLASRASGRHLVLLNSDAQLVDGSLDELVRFADEYPVHGIYSGRIVDDDGRTDPRSCWGLPSAWSLFCFATGLSTAFRGSRVLDPESLGGWGRDTVRAIGAVSGAFALVDRSAWERLGGFDETFFMYSEDIDLCTRARTLGYRPVHVPAAVAIHEGGASSSAPGKMVMVMRGKVTYVRKHWRGLRRRLGLSMLSLGVATRSLLSSVFRRSSVWPEVWDRRGEWRSGYRLEGEGPS